MIAFEATDLSGRPISGLLCKDCRSEAKRRGRIDAQSAKEHVA